MAAEYEIMMSEPAWEEFWTYVDLCTGEVAAFGYAEEHEDKKGGYLYVPEIFLVPQEVSSGGVDILKDGLPYAVEKAAKEDKLDQLRFCVHSHGSMSTFFSQTDKDMVEKIKKYAPDLPWFASAVFNRKHEKYAQVDVWYPEPPLTGLGQHVIVKSDIFSEAKLEHVDEAKKKLAEFVTEKKYHARAKTATGQKGTSKTKQSSATQHDPDEKGEDPNHDLADYGFGWGDTEYDKELRAEAIKQGWEVIPSTDGMYHFWDPDAEGNKYKGQACEPDEYTDEWLEYLMKNEPGKDA